MKNTKTILVLAALVVILAGIAAGFGVFGQGNGETVAVTSFRGEEVQLYGHGLYRYDSLSGASQEIAQDAVTLFVGIPLLVLAMVLTAKSKLRGRLLLSGAFAYFLYTYASMCFLTAYNHFFLIYVALFSLNLFGLILSISGLDPNLVASKVQKNYPRKWVSIFNFFLSAFLIMAWGGLLAPSLLGNAVPKGLETYTTMVIQAMDLGVIVPAFTLAGILLWQKRPWGYTLASVLLLKGLMMGLALVAMIVNQMITGVQVDVVTSAIFCLVSLAGIVLTVLVMRNIKD